MFVGQSLLVLNTRMKGQLEALGAYGNLLSDVVRDIAKNGVNIKDTARYIVWIGVSSIPIVLITAIFTGMVLAMQMAYGLHRFGAKNYVGNLVGLALARELGPVLTAIMVCGRVGAGVAAEISSMAVTEQIDAIRALGANPIQKLITPRIVAGTLCLPLLTGLAVITGVFGGLVVSVLELNIPAFQYYRSYLYAVQIHDVTDGLIKSALFGLLIISIACFKGMRVRGGTEGVGIATTAAVVTGCLAIFISNFFVTKLLILLTY